MTLSVMRMLEPDEQDVEMGQDIYCLTQEGGATVYGGIEEWVRDRDDHAVMFLTQEVQEVLDSEHDHYAFVLPVDQMDLVQNVVGRFVLEAGGKAVDTRPPLG